MKALALLALAPLAAFADVPGNVSGVDGITKDGRFLIWHGQEFYDSSEVTVVQDLLTGAQQAFELDKADAWKQAHPVLPMTAGRTSPDKKAQADVIAEDVASAGGWVGDTWTSGSASEWKLVIKRGAAQGIAARCEPAGSVEVYWTPDGKRTIWVVHHSGNSMRDPGYDNLIVGTDGNPGVAVALDKAKLKDADKISASLARAGFTVLAVTPAKKSRDKSVVYAAAGHEDEAKKLAAAVPGGAEVAKLDWKSQVDLVVALAPDAVK